MSDDLFDTLMAVLFAVACVAAVFLVSSGVL